MPQIFQVLRCCKCLVFQVHQTKKSNRFECKLCGEKQSIKRHFGIGNGKECRLHVQRLNTLRGEKDENEANESNTDDDNESENDEDGVYVTTVNGGLGKNVKSKWSDYVETNEEPQEDSTETMYLGKEEVVLEVPIKRRKKIGNSNNKTAKTSILKSINRSETVKENFNTNGICNKSCKPVSANICIANPKIQDNETNESKIIPPTINKYSKWVQYTDDEPSAENNTSVSSTEITKDHTTKGMFSLCEDSDIDDVLDI